MSTNRVSRLRGFALLEALIALIIVALGLLAIAQVQTVSVMGSGESKSRAEAAHLSQQKLEELRNLLRKGDFTALASGASAVNGTSETYALAWTVTTPNATLEQRLVQIATTWTDSRGVSQSLDLNSLVAWDDPYSQAGLTKDSSGTLISPTGSAQRGSGIHPVPVSATTNSDGTRTFADAGTTYLTQADGTIILYLRPKADGTPQHFTRITGRVYFDQNANNNAIPAPSDTKVRLSSEGECIYSNASLTAVSAGANSYQYYTYTCYVGPGWYGNVGVTVVDNSSPTICVGDPSFNGGVSNSTLTSAHPVETAVRTYRGFRAGASVGSYLSTGVAEDRRYGLSLDSAGQPMTGPFDGKPSPSSYPAFYPTVAAGSATDYLNQDFLITKINNNASCSGKMTGGLFTRNAGKYLCISPDRSVDLPDQCPNVWPGFEGEVGVGGSINYTLTVLPAGNGTGTVTSSSGGINCGATCAGSYASGTAVVLTAVAANGSTFAGWSGGGCAGTSPCTLSLTAGQGVTATFNVAGGAFTLGLTKAGSGTVTSSPLGIDCGSTCSAQFNAGTSVTLTAVAQGGASFTGWSGGGCSGVGACTVTLNAGANVTATFSNAATQYALSVSKLGAGSGTVTSAPAGINCGGTCSADFASGTAVTLTATAGVGSTFTGWSGGGCSGVGSCVVAVNAATGVVATIATAVTCAAPVSGTAHDKSGTVTTSPAGYGICSMNGGNSSGYSCSFTAPQGTPITLTNERSAGANSYSYNLTITHSCAAQTNANFP